MKGYNIFLIFITILTFAYGRRVGSPCPRSSEIPCDDGECIWSSFWCDGRSDCTDRTDEKYCLKGAFNNCTDKHFTCGDGICIPLVLRCNTWSDCHDSSDEENCDSDDAREINTTPQTTTEIYTSSSPTDYYGRRIDETNNHGRQNVYSPTQLVSHPIPGSLPSPFFPGYNANNQQKLADVRPNQNFPSNQNPINPRMPVGASQPRTRQYPTPGYPIVNRELPVVFPPRNVLYQPRSSTSSASRRTATRTDYSPFFFAKNYTKDYGYDYKTNIRKAKNWLLSQRDGSYTWGRDTPRALIALSLIHNSFKSDFEDNELMMKSFQTHLGLKLLRNDTGIEKMSTTRLAVYIHALLATCQDPNNFLGLNLTDILLRRQHILEENQRFVNPIIYLSLCLMDMPVQVDYLQHFLLNSFPSEISKDIHILAMSAMACVEHRNPHDSFVRDKLNAAAHYLLREMNTTNGSFGSKYSTALAAQALMSTNVSLRFDPRKSLDYLAQQQDQDGSFGDMQSTYYILPALSGRGLVHLRNTVCDPVHTKTVTGECSPDDIMNQEGPRKTILYTLRADYPETFSAAIQLSVPVHTNFFEIMCVAAQMDARFKFEYEISKGYYGVHTIANVPNDSERGMFWSLYWVPFASNKIDLKNRHFHDVKSIIPNDEDELIFWYLSDI